MTDLDRANLMAEAKQRADALEEKLTVNAAFGLAAKWTGVDVANEILFLLRSIERLSSP